MVSTILFALALTGAPSLAEASRPLFPRPYVEIWTRGDGVFRRGDRARVFFRSDGDGYVTVFRVDTDGRVRILFPHDPWDDNYVYGGRDYEVIQPYDRAGHYAFTVDEYPGQGYLFAVVSYEPFAYDAYTLRDHWDYRAIAYHGRITGDPYVAFTDLIDRILPYGYVDYAVDVQPYYVDRHYQYPRFLCYDCHTHVSYAYWNPYRHSCVRFQIVVYDDPYYYPARAYPGTRVVYQRPVRYEPKYVFKDRVASAPDITTGRRRQANEPATGRRVSERGVTGRDMGGVGTIPAPAGRVPAASDDAAGTSGRRGTAERSGRANEAPSSEPAVPPELRRPSVRPEEDRDGATRVRPQLERREPVRAPSGKRQADSAPPAPDPRGTPRRAEDADRARRGPEAKPESSRVDPRATPSRRPTPSASPRATPPRPQPARRAEPKKDDDKKKDEKKKKDDD
jgi:hypothetical protein